MKGQKDVAIFFHKQAALERQKAKESADRRRNKGVREFLTAEEIKQLAQKAKGKRKEDKEKQLKERKEAFAKEEKDKKWARAAAKRLNNLKDYKSFLGPKRRKGSTVDHNHEEGLMQKLNETFPEDVTEKSQESQEISDVGLPLEISKLKYHAAVPMPKNNKQIYRRPITRASFSGMMMNPKGGNGTICKNIDPRWVDYHFQNVFVHLVMLHPEVRMPVPIGSTRPAEEKAPENCW
jgi:hypothetical protein